MQHSTKCLFPQSKGPVLLPARITDAHPRNMWLDSSIVAILTLLWMLLFSPTQVFAIATQAHAPNLPALSYNCTTASSTSGHCYALQKWGGTNGADTRISINPSLQGGCCNGFVTTELWLVTSDNQYWVEAGVSSDSSSGNIPYVFWADQRPGGGYAEHDGGFLNNTDYSGANVLARITRSGTSSWNTLVRGSSTTMTGTSTSNNITIGYIEIGTEIYGTSGAYENDTYYGNNRWWSSSNGTFTYQNNLGDGTSLTGPLEVNWVSNENPKQISTGGVLFTCLPGSGC